MDIDNTIIETNSESETIEFARGFARGLSRGCVVLLHGDLGMGKSVFARAVIRALCGENTEVPSPTFTLVQTYEAQDHESKYHDAEIGMIWHFDLYRLSDASEIYELGWEEALADGLLLVEWPERLAHLLPASYIDVTISPIIGDPDKRQIEVKTHG